MTKLNYSILFFLLCVVQSGTLLFRLNSKQPQYINTYRVYAPGQALQTAAPPAKTEEKAEDITIRLYNHTTNTIEVILLEDYIFGVVLAEMPYDYPPEALKAGAVAARTYTMYQIENNKEAKYDMHRGADICTDYRHCQAYLSYTESVEAWSEKLAGIIYEKIKSAVDDTKGEVIKYDGKVINAVYHASSYARTENAENLWGQPLPYLQSVRSDEEDSADIVTTVTVSYTDFLNRLTLAGYPCKETRLEIENNNTGRVEQLHLDGSASVSGKKMREIFNLKSTCFSIAQNGEDIVFTVYGYGHGVGLSQNGASRMAENGKTYVEILRHYYSGTEIELI